MFMRSPRTGRTTMPGSTGKEGASRSRFRYEGLNSGSNSYSYAGPKYGVSGDIGSPPEEDPPSSRPGRPDNDGTDPTFNTNSARHSGVVDGRQGWMACRSCSGRGVGSGCHD